MLKTGVSLISLFSMLISSCGVSTSSKVTDLPTPFDSSSLDGFLKEKEGLRAVLFADWSHGAAAPIDGLAKSIPDLLKWGMTSLVMESWDIGYECMNRFVTADMNASQKLEDFCDRDRYTGRFGGEMIYVFDANLRREEAYHKILLQIREWNQTAVRKVVIRPVDGAMRDSRIYLDPNKVNWVLPHRTPAPDSEQRDWGGHNLSEIIRAATPFATLKHAYETRLANPYYGYATYQVALMLRGVEDQYNFNRFDFFRDPSEKLVVLYGAAHLAAYNYPGTYDDKDIPFLYRTLTAAYGKGAVSSIFAVGEDDSQSPPSASKFSELAIARGPGIYESKSFGELPCSVAFMHSKDVFVREEQMQDPSCMTTAEAFDLYLVR